MSQGAQAQYRQMAQKRAELRNYNLAKQQIKVSDRNQALSVLNSQMNQNQQSVGVMQRQYNVQQQQMQQQQLQQREKAVALLHTQNLQNQMQRQPGNRPGNPQAFGTPMQQQYMMQQGYNPNMMQQQGYNPNMMNMAPQQGYNPAMMNVQQQFFNPAMVQQTGFNPAIMNMTQQQVNTQSQLNQPQGAATTSTAPPQPVSVYTEPNWSAKPQFRYQLRLVENGNVSHVDLCSKTFLIVGRQETCDIQLETPSVSRQHATIQHRGGGSKQGSDELFIYDLSSTSGTFLNSQQLNPRAYYALQPGDVINFASSPDFVVCGGPNNFQPPLPVVQTPLPTSTPNFQEATKEQKLGDEMEAIVHARCSDHLVSSLAQLEKLFENGQILDEQYYKKKALIQDQMQRQQEEKKQIILKKKAEARSKQHLEDVASRQRAQQEALRMQSVEEKAAKIVDSSDDPFAGIQQTASPTRNIDRTAEQAFSSSLSSQNTTGKKSNYSCGTIKMDPRSADFDAVAYKRMMVEQYEQQKRDNEIKLRLRKLGDPSNDEFNPEEYKRLMVEKYEHERQMTETKRLLQEARG